MPWRPPPHETRDIGWDNWLMLTIAIVSAATVHLLMVVVPTAKIESTQALIDSVYLDVSNNYRLGLTYEQVAAKLLDRSATQAGQWQIDSWGNPIELELRSDATFALHSLGPDGRDNTTDDIYPSAAARLPWRGDVAALGSSAESERRTENRTEPIRNDQNRATQDSDLSDDSQPTQPAPSDRPPDNAQKNAAWHDVDRVDRGVHHHRQHVRRIDRCGGPARQQ